MNQSRRFYLIVLLSLVASLLLLSSSFLHKYRRAVNDVEEPKDHDKQPWDIADWSRFAYVQYATNSAYLCNSVMIFESLHRLKCKADRLLMYSSSFSLDDNSTESALLRKAKDEYGAILKPIEVQRKSFVERELQSQATKLTSRLT